MNSSNSFIVASGKGGTGKTSFVAALGTVMAQCDRRVAVVDMDMGQRSLDLALGLENRVVFDISDVSRGICRLKQAIISPDGLERLSMISASQVNPANRIDKEKCASVINELARTNDIVLIDAPSGVGSGLELCCACARSALIVTTPEAASVRDASRAINVMREMGVTDFQIVVNRVKPWQTTIEYDINSDTISEWLSANVIAQISENSAQRPLMGNPEIAKIARSLASDQSIAWPKTRPSLAKRLISAITPFRKRKDNAESI